MSPASRYAGTTSHYSSPYKGPADSTASAIIHQLHTTYNEFTR